VLQAGARPREDSVAAVVARGAVLDVVEAAGEVDAGVVRCRAKRPIVQSLDIEHLIEVGRGGALVDAGEPEAADLAVLDRDAAVATQIDAVVTGTTIVPA